jgi:bile acid-coenzyme A ligase
VTRVDLEQFAGTPLAAVLRRLVAEDPDAPAVTDDDGTISRRELDRLSNRWAHGLAERGVRQGDVVSIALPSDRWFLVAAWAAWKAGATPQPLSFRIAPQELRDIVELTQPRVVVTSAVGLPDLPGVAVWDGSGADGLGADPLPDAVAPSWKAPTSGGSTGRPKVILSTTPSVVEPLVDLAGGLLRIREGEVLLTPAPLHHNAPFLFSSLALIRGGHAVVMRRFDPQRVLDLVERHRVTWLYAVPTILSRIAKLPPESTAGADLGSIVTLYHMAAPCPEWVKRWWIDRIGPEQVWELYTGTEFQAVTALDGREWLAHPGSVGRAVVGEVTVLDADGAPVPPGTVGEVFLRSTSGRPTYRYLGATARRIGDWESLGDLGHLDADGFLYLSDRAKDMVLVGGVNVYPAEVEAALDAHPQVVSSCVVGLPDEDLGNVLHAVVQLAEPLHDDDLRAFLAERLAPYKQPRTFDRSAVPLRDDAGKVRRSAVRDEAIARRGKDGAAHAH